MESVNLIRGYSSVRSINIEDKNHNTITRKLSNPTIIAITSLLLLTLLIGVLLSLLIHEANTEEPFDDIEDSLQTVCSVTRYPSSCLNSLLPFNLSKKTDPEIIFKLSLQVSIKELTNVSSQFRSLLLNEQGKGFNSVAAVDDCVSLFDDALTSVNDSLMAMEVSDGEKMLNLEKVNDIRTWISAAMTNQETCFDGLREMDQNQMGSKSMVVCEAVGDSIGRSKELLSNSLAIVSNMHKLLDRCDLEFH